MDGLQTLQQLSFGTRFRIPDYQRSYSWTKRQWQDLLEDLDALRRDRNHFTGTLVLQSAADGVAITDRDSIQYQVVDVVDGQQRLTTLTLLLDAIRRALREEGHEPLADGIGRNYVWILNRDGLRIPRLVFTDDSDGFFNGEIVQETPGSTSPKTPAQERLLEASRYFSAYLADMRPTVSEPFADWLQSLQAKVTNRLLFTTYRPGPSDDVGMIFEALNDRGLDLSEMDKVKNYVIYLAEQMDIAPESERAMKLEVKTAWGRDLWKPHAGRPRISSQRGPAPPKPPADGVRERAAKPSRDRKPHGQGSVQS